MAASADLASSVATPLLQETPVFPKVVVKDIVYKDSLELICFHSEKLVARQLIGQCPGGGGVFAQPSAEVYAETASCPTTNRLGEKDFSSLDRERNRAPQKSTLHLSGGITFRNNHSWAHLSTSKRGETSSFGTCHSVSTFLNRERCKKIREE